MFNTYNQYKKNDDCPYQNVVDKNCDDDTTSLLNSSIRTETERPKPTKTNQYPSEISINYTPLTFVKELWSNKVFAFIVVLL